jgi:hypothetical protein
MLHQVIWGGQIMGGTAQTPGPRMNVCRLGVAFLTSNHSGQPHARLPGLFPLDAKTILLGTGSWFAETTAKPPKKPRSFSRAPQLSFGVVLGSSLGFSPANSVGGPFKFLPTSQPTPATTHTKWPQHQ